MAATHLGTVDQYTPGAQTNIDATSGITLTRVRVMPADAAYDINAHPALLSRVEHMGSVIALLRIQLRTVEGGMVECSYEYGTGTPKGDPNGPPSDTIPVGGGSTETYSLDVSMESVSILRWAFEKYAISRADKRVLAAMVQFGPLDGDGNAIRRFLSGDTDAETIANKIEDGFISKLSPVYVWRVRRTSTSWTITEPIGKISTPPGPVPSIPGGGNWLFMGATAQGLDNRAAEMELTWQSSIAGDEWDADIYGT